MSVYGPIVTADTVEQAALDTLQLWLPAYLGEVGGNADALGRTSLPDIRTYGEPTGEFAKWPEDQLPFLLTGSAGTDGTPTTDGDGNVSSWFSLAAVVVCSANSQRATRRLAQLYAAAVRTCLGQKGALGGLADHTELRGETYDELPESQRRSMAAARIEFGVYVSDIFNVHGGPATPPEPDRDPSPDLATVVATDVQVVPQ
jgi:hypothetical protein